MNREGFRYCKGNPDYMRGVAINSSSLTNKSAYKLKGSNKIKNIHPVISECWDKIKYMKASLYVPYEACSKHQNDYGNECTCLEYAEKIERTIKDIQEQLDMIKQVKAKKE